MQVTRSPVPLLQACSRSEAQPTFDALLLVLKKLCSQFGFEDVHIKSWGIDHCWASRNAAVEAQADVNIVDCSAHIARKLTEHRHKYVYVCVYICNIYDF